MGAKQPYTIYERDIAMDKGLIHYYYGFGKGKTTAAMGLALRASGSGRKVVIVQFLKNRKSCELLQLEKLDNIKVLRGQSTNAFSNEMNKDDIISTTQIHNLNLSEACEYVQAGECDMLILDEVTDAYELGMLDEDMFMEIVKNKPENLELVITGHNPQAWIADIADYVTRMQKDKHPYDRGIMARYGIEF